MVSTKDHKANGFDEREEYKKLFKIRDEIFVKMQETMQSSEMGFFNSNTRFKGPPTRTKHVEQPKYPQALSRVASKHKQSSSLSVEIPVEDNRNRLERMLRARIEKRKADTKLLVGQSPSKKHIEQRAFSSHVHYKKNKESWDEIKQITKTSSYNEELSSRNIQEIPSIDPEHVQESSVTESSRYQNEKLKSNQTYNENKEELTPDFLSKSMAIPGLRVSAHICEENTPGSNTEPTITQNIEEKNIYNKDILENLTTKSPNLSLESKLMSHNFQTHESNTQNISRSSSLEYKPRSPNSHLHLSHLLSPKITEDATETERLTKAKSVSEPRSHCSGTTNENPQSANHLKKENKRIDNYAELGNLYNLAEHYNYEPYKQTISPRSMYFRNDFYPRYQQPPTHTWYGSQNYPGHFFPEDKPYVYFRNRAYLSTYQPPPIGLHDTSSEIYDYSSYYMPEFSPIRPPISSRMTHFYPPHPMRFPHVSPFPRSPSLHRYVHDKYSSHSYSSYPYSMYPPSRYEDSMAHPHDSAYFYQHPRNAYEWEDPVDYNPHPERPMPRSFDLGPRYGTEMPYETYVRTEPGFNTKQTMDHQSKNWNQWSRDR